VRYSKLGNVFKTKSQTIWLRMVLLATVLFLYMPIVILIVFSFNDSRRNITWKGFTLKYYEKVFLNESLIEAFVNSLSIALVASFISLVLGTLTAILLWRFQFPAKTLYRGVILLPIVVPEICMGVALLIFFNWIGWSQNLLWPLSLLKIICAHVLFCFPFVTIVVRARLGGLKKEYEEAAIDLGAGGWRVFRDIWIPYLKPSLVAGSLLSFTLSLDDFVITFFTSGPNTVTVPIKIYSMVRFSVTPEVNAASTILILVTVISAWTAILLQKDSPGRENSLW